MLVLLCVLTNTFFFCNVIDSTNAVMLATSIFWLLAATVSAQVNVHAVFSLPPEVVETRQAHLAENVSSALYEMALLRRYSILNRSNEYIPSPLPAPLLLIGQVTLAETDGEVVRGVLERSSMVSFTFDRNATAQLFLFSANTFLGTDAMAPFMNPLQRLGIVGAQLALPVDVQSDDTVSVKVTVALAVLVFVLTLTASAVSTRRRLIRESRGINFNELIQLEVELYDDVDRKLMML